ncbi:CwfJ C-terminus 1-domain-containing protein-like protein [Pelagophyceae sp. CCMP2097]|nr:CwfJ C-terminus 1-domain-containing protein-like protein [Pelagophyceae sp. CCMP2097]|mmetsp:Transcript_13721/g.45771  ORF Transcript_13721/g.45771 Transcript_13721/m.45771 type:complete len:635 (-) Transcript_13721:55-1959(-)
MKVLVCGDVEGRFEATFARVAKLDASSGPFDALFCCGAFFDAEAPRTPPGCAVPTYFFECAGAPAPLAAGAVVAENVTYLGAAGLASIKPRVDDASGRSLTVAFLAGADGARGLQILKATADEPGYCGADVFLSSEWPRGIDVGVDGAVHAAMAASVQVHLQAVGDAGVAAAAVAVRPRYHFAGAHGAFWARPPFRLQRLAPTQARTHVSRFVALGRAAFSGDKARRWLHAIDIEPTPYATVAALTAEPADATDSPFSTESEASRRFASLESSDRKRSAAKASDEEAHKDRITWGAQQSVKRGRGDAPRAGDPNSKTLFVGNVAHASAIEDLAALVAKALEPHGVAADDVRLPQGKGFGFLDFATREAADQALATLSAVPLELEGRALNFDWGAAGGAPQHAKNVHAMEERRDCWFCLASPGCETHLIVAVGDACYLAQPKGPLADAHVLVVPIAHAARLGADLDSAAYAELERFSVAAAACHRGALGASTLGVERFADVRGQFHAHRQLIPVAGVSGPDLVAKLHARARAALFELQQVDAEAPFVPGDASTFYIVLDVFDGETGARSRFACTAPGGGRARFKVPLQFGREVGADALGAPERADWKVCAQSQEEEAKLCNAFKEVFAPYAPKSE